MRKGQESRGDGETREGRQGKGEKQGERERGRITNAQCPTTNTNNQHQQPTNHYPLYRRDVPRVSTTTNHQPPTTNHQPLTNYFLLLALKKIRYTQREANQV
jgi:hypothetical protein